MVSEAFNSPWPTLQRAATDLAACSMIDVDAALGAVAVLDNFEVVIFGSSNPNQP